MNRNSISLESDDFDEYPEISATDLDGAIHRRNFVEIPQKQSINLMLDTNIIAWFKKKSGEVEFQSLINAALRDVISHSLKPVRAAAITNWYWCLTNTKPSTPYYNKTPPKANAY